jgi:hypothetical protein
MSEFIIGTIFGIGVGGIFTALLFLGSVETSNMYHKAKAPCEEALPRNQQCIMTFQPE